MKTIFANTIVRIVAILPFSNKYSTDRTCFRLAQLPCLALVMMTVVVFYSNHSYAEDDCARLQEQSPTKLLTAVGTIYDSIFMMKTRSMEALFTFDDIINIPPVTNTSYHDFFGDLLVKGVIDRVASTIPGVDFAVDAVTGLIDVAKGKNEKDTEVKRTVAKWLLREKINLNAVYEFNQRADLNCKYAKLYADLTTDEEQENFIYNLYRFSDGIKDNTLPANLVLLKTLEYWLQDHSNSGKGKAGGAIQLLYHMKADERGIVASLKVLGPAYSKNIGLAFNALLKANNMVPFDLKVNKIIMLKTKIPYYLKPEKEHRTKEEYDLWSKTYITGVGILGPHNNVIKAPYLNVIKEFNEKFDFNLFNDSLSAAIDNRQIEVFDDMVKRKFGYLGITKFTE